MWGLEDVESFIWVQFNSILEQRYANHYAKVTKADKDDQRPRLRTLEQAQKSQDRNRHISLSLFFTVFMFGEIVAETLKRGKLTLLEDCSRVQREGWFSPIHTAHFMGLLGES